jgi:hypothetical protein
MKPRRMAGFFLAMFLTVFFNKAEQFPLKMGSSEGTGVFRSCIKAEKKTPHPIKRSQARQNA